MVNGYRSKGGWDGLKAVITLAAALSVFLQGCIISKRPLAVGDRAPSFTLPSGAAPGGVKVSLTDFVGKQPVLLYFSMVDG
jgi:hypothetical protein